MERDGANDDRSAEPAAREDSQHDEALPGDDPSEDDAEQQFRRDANPAAANQTQQGRSQVDRQRIHDKTPALLWAGVL
jgi:hypothetical protein